jgi:GT2 family glycosyltransferase
MSVFRAKVAVVLLNYNSEDDLCISIKQIQKQTGIELVTVIVDNASSSKTVENIKKWPESSMPTTFFGSTNDVTELTANNQLDISTFSTYFIFNGENKGYSAGNNIGAKLAGNLGVDAVLIANPDMRFEDENYVYMLTKTLFSNDSYAIASSSIIGLDGKDQTPLREASFLEEVLWPLSYVKPISYVLPFDPEKIITIPKTMGCCLLLRMTFLNEIGYFDEGTFLYSEEPILAAQVRNNGFKIVFNPTIKAIHAHKVSEKDNSSKRMFEFIKSRKYYLKKYSGYNKFQLMLLNVSYALLSLTHYMKYKMSK